MAASFLKALVLVSIILGLARTLNAGGKCCPGDTICSGCWMCEGSDLRDCWDKATPLPSKCEAISDLQQKASCYCKAYAAIAKCWSAGTCCTEYAPTLAAATDLCNLATYPSDQIQSWQLDAAVKEAARVANAIWHNDSGRDVPKCNSHIEPYTGGAVATGTAVASPPGGGSTGKSSSSYTSNGEVAPPKSSQNNYTKYTQHYNNHAKAFKSKWNEKKEEKKDDEQKWKDEKKKDEKKWKDEKKEDEKKWKEEKEEKKWKDEKKEDEKKWKEEKSYKADDKKYYEKSDDDQSGCGGKKVKRSIVRRASYSIILPTSEELRAGRRLFKRDKGQCGTDFQNVKYPETVPQLVQKAYDEI